MIGNGAPGAETARTGTRIGAEAVHASLSCWTLGVGEALGPAALVAGPDEPGQANARCRAGRRGLAPRVELDARVRSARLGYHWNARFFDLI